MDVAYFPILHSAIFYDPTVNFKSGYLWIWPNARQDRNKFGSPSEGKKWNICGHALRVHCFIS